MTELTAQMTVAGGRGGQSRLLAVGLASAASGLRFSELLLNNLVKTDIAGFQSH